MKSVTTNKGSILPLISLKGKDYLQVAHRLQWLADDFPHYTISTEFLQNTEEYAVCRATVTIFGDTTNDFGERPVIRRATATKQESKRDFGDFMEKAETGAIGRTLAMLGLGTQHAISDLDEGSRIVDSPVTNVKDEIKKETAPAPKGPAVTSKPSFRKAASMQLSPPQEESVDGWD